MIDDKYLDKFMKDLNSRVANLYEGLDAFLLESEPREMKDYWYEYDADIIDRILKDFTDADWLKLLQNIKLKSDDWKRKLAYCLTDNENENKYELEILLGFINTDDDELFLLTIDALRDRFNTDESKAFIMKENPDIIEKVKNKILNAGIVTKKILEVFVSQMTE